MASGALYALLFEPADYPEYYFVCALFDALLVFLYKLLGQNALVHDLQILALTSIANQAFGFVLYETYLLPTSYNVILFLLKAAEWVRIIMVRTDDKLPTNHWRPDYLFHDLHGRAKRNIATENL